MGLKLLTLGEIFIKSSFFIGMIYYPLLLEKIDNAVKPSDLKIFILPIWVRFYDIPFKGRGNDETRVLLNKIGMFV